jgi:FkbM family methyltransferase
MRRLYLLVEAVWREARGPLRALFGEERLGRILDAFGLRAMKSRHFILEQKVADGSAFLYRPHDQCILDEVFNEHAYGADAAFEPGQTVIDVGGHIGAFACLTARRVGPSGRVITCEPAPDNAALLRENLSRNGFTWARVHEAAVGEKPGEIDLYVADQASDNPAANTIFPSAGRKAVKVRLTTLDAICAEEGISRVDHLKLDIEGAELQALRGAEKTLAMTRRIVMEVHPERVEPQTVLDFLSAHGFAPKVLSRKPGSWLVEARRA